MAFTIGLSGGIGSGKSTIARAFEAHGIAVIDADAIAHRLTASGGAAMASIRTSFGERFITPDGALDRALMRSHVFAAPAERQRLEAILHPLIRAGTAQAADAASSPYRILMIPLLVEAQQHDPAWRTRFDRILVVDCAEETQVRRVMARSGLSAQEVRLIMAAQATRPQRRAAADDVIDNEDESLPLELRVDQLHQLYLAAAHGKAAAARF